MNENTSRVIRLAKPSDVDALTDLHCACFRPEEHVPMMLGPRYVRATYRWLISGGEAYCLVAEAGTRLVGLIAVADRSYTMPMFKACLGEFVVSLARNPFLLTKRQLWERLLRRSQDMSGQGQEIAGYAGIAQITIGAVAADYRGQNVFSVLVEATKDASRQRGSRGIRVGIYKPNTASRRVFIKGGWLETPELETADTVFYMACLDPTLSGELGILTSR